jgi:large subunit ribosomal protein L28
LPGAVFAPILQALHFAVGGFWPMVDFQVCGFRPHCPGLLRWIMPNVCPLTGKKTSRGMKRAWRGQAVAKGGFGLKPTGITRRSFKPNMQEIVAVMDGKQTRVRVSTKAIRTGMVVKALKRKFGYTRQQKAAAGK